MPFAPSATANREEQLDRVAELQPRFGDKRSNSALHHPSLFAAGTIGPSVLTMLCHLSYKGSRRWRDSNPQRQRRSSSCLRHVRKLFKSAHTSTVQVGQASACVPLQSHRKNLREESALTEPGFEPEPFGFYHEVAVSFTIPREEKTLPRNGCLWIEMI